MQITLNQNEIEQAIYEKYGETLKKISPDLKITMSAGRGENGIKAEINVSTLKQADTEPEEIAPAEPPFKSLNFNADSGDDNPLIG